MTRLHPSETVMLNRLVLELLKSPNNGRKIARLPDGRWLLLAHSEIMGLPGLEPGTNGL